MNKSKILNELWQYVAKTDIDIDNLIDFLRDRFGNKASRFYSEE